MVAQRQYESAMVFNCRIVDLRHLWTPSTEYKGKPQDKPSWFSAFIVPKTVQQWHEEPVLGAVAQACGNIWKNNPQVVDWPVMNGDLPSREGKTSEWAKGHWIFGASTSNKPKIEIVGAGNSLSPLQGQVGVKAGDFCMVGVTAAVKQNDPRAVKLYLNTTVFTAPGTEIVFANSVSGAEMLAAAQQQGIAVQGFGSMQQSGGSPFGGGQQNGGFSHGAPNGQNGGFVPNGMGTAGPFGATGVAPGQAGAFGAGSGNATSPFSGGAPQRSGPFG